MFETMQSSHRLCPVMALVRALLTPVVSDNGDGAHFRPFFMGGDPQSSHQEVTVESGGNFEGWERSGEKA